MNKRFFRGMIMGMLISVALICIGYGVFKYISTRPDNPPTLELDQSSTGQIKGDAGSISSSKIDEQAKSDFQTKMGLISEMIDRYYLNEVDREKMYDLMLRSMVYSLGDPYSAYYTPEEFNSLLETTSGKYCGIGALVSQNINDMKIMVIQPFEKSPAYKAGMLPNDEIISVDGKSVVGTDINSVVALMKGEKGTHVKVGVLRDGETYEFDIIRDEVETEYVSSKMLANNVGYVAISEFFELTSNQLKEHMDKLVQQGANKFILDLRGNPGGLYSDVIKCLDYFVEKGQLLIYTEDKNGKREEDFAKNGVLYDYPIVILVDDQSASAAEIFTGTMQCYKKATIVGTKTFGKGIVQALYPVGFDGSGLKITISKYYLPSGICIHETGIAPDVEIELDEDLKKILASRRDHDNQIDKAMEILNGK